MPTAICRFSRIVHTEREALNGNDNVEGRFNILMFLTTVKFEELLQIFYLFTRMLIKIYECSGSFSLAS